MKVRFILITIVFTIVWESFLGHTRVFSYFDPFAIFCVNYFFYVRDTRFLVSYAIIVGLLVDLVIVRWLGIASFGFIGAMFVVLIINRVFELMRQDRILIVYFLFILLYKFILVVIDYLLFDLRFELGNFAVSFLITFIFALLINKYFFKIYKSRALKV